MTRRILAALCVAALAWTTASWAQTRTPAARELTVLTFNIHHGVGVDGKLDVARIAQLIRDSKADIVGLQEVDRGVERSGRRDLLKEIADLTGMRFAFGKNLDVAGGDYGNALLTSLPIVSEGNKALPADGNSEPRGALQVVLDVDGKRVLVLVTHFDHRRDSPLREASADALLASLEAWGPGPAIALGDFNDVPGSPAYTRMATVFTDAWAAVGEGEGFTIPVESPRRRIDWILVRGLEPVRAQVLESQASDHLPVVAVVRLK